MKLSAAASARIGLGASIGMILLSAFLLYADPAGTAIWLLISAIPLALPLLIGNRKHRIYALLILLFIGISCGTALTRMNRQLNRTIRQLIELRTKNAPVE